jgi:hypothetical protein
MKDPSRLVGTYLLGLEPLLVSAVDEDVFIRLAGVPEELAARLIRSDNSYVINGSQLEGATIDFAEGDPSPGGRVGGMIDFVRSADPVLASGRGLRMAPVDWHAEEEEHYREVADRILENHDGKTIEWHLQWDKWRFVDWISKQGQFIFHGSPLPDVDAFLPRRNSVELMDQGGAGNRAAVYGTPYGLWAMWFAVIDRDKITGSIRSGVWTWTDRTGNPIDIYNFSVHHEIAGGDIWRSGTLYLFRRDEFRPIPFYPGGPASNEWASETVVNPLGRLAIEPADFPFRDQVGGHDDGELIAAEAVADIVKSRITEARAVPGGIVLSLKWDDEVARVWDEYLASRLRFNPDVELILSLDDTENATIDVRGPDGYLQAYTTSLLKSGVPVEH